MLRDPQGRGKEKSSPDQHHVLVILGEEAECKEDVQLTSEGERLLLHPLIQGLKTDFTESTCASEFTEAVVV